MTYREYIKKFGFDHFVMIAKGWFDIDATIKYYLDKDISRYALFADKPLFVSQRLYSEDYKNGYDETFYSWLEDTITEAEQIELEKRINEILNK